LLIKCGDCDEKFEIYYGPDGEDLEIAGVLASVANWRKILGPLLKMPRFSKSLLCLGTGRIREFTRSPIAQSARSQRAGLSVNSLDFARSSSSYRGRHG
jgi:hypothetical protein